MWAGYIGWVWYINPRQCRSQHHNSNCLQSIKFKNHSNTYSNRLFNMVRITVSIFGLTNFQYFYSNLIFLFQLAIAVLACSLYVAVADQAQSSYFILGGGSGERRVVSFIIVIKYFQSIIWIFNVSFRAMHLAVKLSKPMHQGQ
jgi:hypothetical protein